MSGFDATANSYKVEANWMSEDPCYAIQKRLAGQLLRFNKRVEQLSRYVIAVRPRRTEVKLRVKQHSGDQVGTEVWFNLMTRDNPSKDERFLQKLLPK